jgi:fructose-bisphosphate aldolase class II
MKTLRELIAEAAAKQVAIGHFNFSTLEGLWAIFAAAKELGVPVIAGVSEGERDFVGVKQAVALVKSFREEYNYPIFLNADHTYSFERVKQAIDAGFDSVIVDGAKLSLEENIKLTKQCVECAQSVNPEIIVEGELGYIGQSSQLLSELPTGAATAGNLTTPEMAADFVKQTGVQLLAPAVGNVHGMLKDQPDPRLDIGRVGEIRAACGVPLVLHGASGNSAADIQAAIKAGAAIVHINTELRVAFRDGLKQSLQTKTDEVAPYKILYDARAGMKKLVLEKLKIFSGIN